MMKYFIGIFVGMALVIVVAIIVVGQHKSSANPPDLDQQVNEVTRNLHPTKLNP